MKKLLCKIGWHGLPFWKSWTDLSSDSVNIHARCNWCGFQGMIDSQGNLF